jgi:hypothetical protein
MICPCGELRDVDSVVALCVDCRRDIEARYSTDRRRRNGAMQRRFVGVELKESYWNVAVKNLKQAEHDNMRQVDLFAEAAHA